MSLRDRLRSMQGAAVAQPDSTPGMPDDLAVNVDPTAASSSTARADTVTVSVPSQPVAPALVTRMRAAYGPEALLPGTECETPHGCCFVAEWRYPLEHRHGHATLGATAGVSLAAASALLARGPREREILGTVDPRRIVYLDTETTGLAGGTGTYAFLVGVARFSATELVVRQFFMRTLSEERALLHLLAQELGICDVLVTYNGKAFDWPLLETRFTLGRRQGPTRPPDPAAHVDLLFAARRLWRSRLENCTLGTVEHHVLGVRRGDDTPGWLIPQLYFTYLRDQDVRPLAGVFRHNVLDVVSLAVLLGRVASIGVAQDAPHAIAADELLGLGRCLEDAGDAARALACYQAALLGAGVSVATFRAAVIAEAHMRAGLLLKRLRRHAEALTHWERLAAEPLTVRGARDVRPLEELAKYYEHIARDRELARTFVLAALESLDEIDSKSAHQERLSLTHRLRRLDRALMTTSAINAR